MPSSIIGKILHAKGFKIPGPKIYSTALKQQQLRKQQQVIDEPPSHPDYQYPPKQTGDRQ